MSSTALTAMLQLQGLPPLPRSLTGFTALQGGGGAYAQPPLSHHHDPPLPHHSQVPRIYGQHFNPLQPRPTPPAPPPRPQSRRSSSSGSSFRASPDHLTNRSALIGGGLEMLRSSPRSLSSSPHSPHVDSGLGRSSADSSSDGRAFIGSVKSPPPIATRLDTQLRQLKNDMQHLRHQDMALLGHLLQIHQGIQDLRQVLIPSPPSGSGQLPLFQSTPSRHPPPKPHHTHQAQSSRLSILSSGATKFFSRRSSSEKLMAEAMGLGGGQDVNLVKGHGGHRHGHGHGQQGRRERRDDESDSLSSLEFGDV